MKTIDDRPYSEKDFEEMFERPEKLSEQYAKEDEQK